MGRKKREPAEVVDHKKQRAEALASLRAKRTKRVSLGGDGLTELSALTIPDGVKITEPAFARSDLFEKRRKMMEAWAAYATAEQGKVVRLGAGV